MTLYGSIHRSRYMSTAHGLRLDDSARKVFVDILFESACTRKSRPVDWRVSDLVGLDVEVGSSGGRR